MIICDFCKSSEDVRHAEIRYMWNVGASLFANVIKKDICKTCEGSKLKETENIFNARFRGVNDISQ